jgi:hypothetical protein
MERALHLNPVPGSSSRETFPYQSGLDLETVLVRDSETGEARHCKVRDLWPEGASPETPAKAEAVELVEITEQDWQRAHERFEIIRPY